jgi:hypothetical protein
LSELFVRWRWEKEAAFNLLIGAVISSTATAISYYFGSSSCSAHKTALSNAGSRLRADAGRPA